MGVFEIHSEDEQGIEDLQNYFLRNPAARAGIVTVAKKSKLPRIYLFPTQQGKECLSVMKFKQVPQTSLFGVAALPWTNYKKLRTEMVSHEIKTEQSLPHYKPLCELKNLSIK